MSVFGIGDGSELVVQGGNYYANNRRGNTVWEDGESERLMEASVNEWIGLRLSMRRCGIAFVVMSLFAYASANAQDRDVSFWTHNGSVMRLEVFGDQYVFRYDAPRVGMIEAGAISGSVMFEGSADESQIGGTAYIFASRCGTFPYRVTGTWSTTRRITMRGQAPQVNRATCRITRLTDDALIFELVRRGGQ